MENENPSKTKQSEGNLTAAFTYFLGWLTGLIFLFLEKEDEFIRFNAAQSVVVFGAVTVVPLLLPPLSVIVGPLGLVLWVILMYKSYKNERVELPLVADLAKSLEKAIKPAEVSPEDTKEEK